MGDFVKWWVRLHIEDGSIDFDLEAIQLPKTLFFYTHQWRVTDVRLTEEGFITATVEEPILPHSYPLVHIVVDPLSGLLLQYEYESNVFVLDGTQYKKAERELPVA